MCEPLLPLSTDADLLGMANDLIGPAIRRRTWLLVLDEDDRLTPIVAPIEGIPVDADPADVALLGTRLAEVVAGVPRAASIVLVWERPGTADLWMQEADWMSGLAATGAPIRAQLLSSDDGVHLVDPTFAALVAG